MRALTCCVIAVCIGYQSHQPPREKPPPKRARPEPRPIAGPPEIDPNNCKAGDQGLFRFGPDILRMPRNAPAGFSVGIESQRIFLRVEQIDGPHDMRAHVVGAVKSTIEPLQPEGRYMFWVKGVPTEDAVTGGDIDVTEVRFRITGTRAYPMTDGGMNTVFVAEAINPPESRTERAARLALASARKKAAAEKLAREQADALRAATVELRPVEGLDGKPGWYAVTVHNAAAVTLDEAPVEIVVAGEVVRSVKIRGIRAGKEKSLTIHVDGASPSCRIGRSSTQPAAGKAP